MLSGTDHEERGDDTVVRDEGLEAQNVGVAVVVHVVVAKALAIVLAADPAQ